MKTLYVTDFDDTLAKTDANVYVTKISGERVTMSPEEYATYEPEEGDNFDFSEFEQLKNARPIKRFSELLKRVVDEKKADKVAVLTARGHTKPIAIFLKNMGITTGVSIAALGDANPQRKANYIEKHIKDGYNRVAFVDDSPKNIAAVDQLKEKYPHIKLLTHQVKKEEPRPRGNTDTNQEKDKNKSSKPTQQVQSGGKSSNYLPGQTWKTSTGNFGGKNKRNQIKYFDTEDKAKQFAST